MPTYLGTYRLHDTAQMFQCSWLTRLTKQVTDHVHAMNEPEIAPSSLTVIGADFEKPPAGSESQDMDGKWDFSVTDLESER